MKKRLESVYYPLRRCQFALRRNPPLGLQGKEQLQMSKDMIAYKAMDAFISVQYYRERSNRPRHWSPKASKTCIRYSAWRNWE